MWKIVVGTGQESCSLLPYIGSMFSQEFVCSDEGEGPGGSLSWRVSAPEVSVLWGLCSGGLHRGGLCPEGSLCYRPPVHLQQRAVRILLECILVTVQIGQEKVLFHIPRPLYRISEFANKDKM